MKLIIYCDGACSHNGSKNAEGGWGYAIYKDSNQTLLDFDHGGEKGTTNNKMELTAAIMGIQRAVEIFERQSQTFYDVDIYTDSAYLHNCKDQHWYKSWQTNNWVNSKKQPVANKELWQILIQYFDDPRFHFYKVKGHAGVQENEFVDELARLGVAEVKNGKGSCS